MSDAPNKPLPLAAIVIAVLLFALVAYPLSVGPAALIANSSWCPEWLEFGLEVVYAPLEWLADNGPDWVRDVIYTYAGWWTTESVRGPSV
jgi:hypothetical protein